MPVLMPILIRNLIRITGNHDNIYNGNHTTDTHADHDDSDNSEKSARHGTHDNNGENEMFPSSSTYHKICNSPKP